MNKPVKKFKCGGCEAAIFENEIEKDGKIIKVKKVTLLKRYKDKDGKWETTYSFSLQDLQMIGLLVEKTLDYSYFGEGTGDFENSNV